MYNEKRQKCAQMQLFLFEMNFTAKSWSEKHFHATDSRTRPSLPNVHLDKGTKSTTDVIDLSIDGAYPVRGRSSPVAFVTILEHEIKRLFTQLL